MRRLNFFGSKPREFNLFVFLVVPHILIVVLGLVLLGILFQSRLSSDAQASFDTILEDVLEKIEDNLSNHVDGLAPEDTQRQSFAEFQSSWYSGLLETTLTFDNTIMLLNSNGAMIASWPSMQVFPRLPPAGVPGTRNFLFSGNEVLAMRVLVSPRFVQVNPKLRVHLAVARSMDYVHAIANTQNNFLLFILVVFFFLLILADFYLVRKLMAPVKELSRSMEAINPDNWEDIQIMTTGPKEFRALSGRFSELIGRLRLGYEQRRRFAEDLAHQVRTPLTVSLMQIDELLRRTEGQDNIYDSLVEQREQIWKLSTTIDTLLMVARFESMSALPRPTTLRVAEIIEDLVELYTPKAEEDGVSVELDLDKSLIIRGDERVFKQAMINLLDNAIKYGVSGKVIRVSVQRQGEKALVVFRNFGKPINEKDLPRLFERFYRSDHNETTGFGLGLSIVKQVVTLHRGTIVVESSKDLGTAFIMHFPVV